VAEPLSAYLEVGSKRVFAGALAWPGWCRSARDEDGALEALLAYGTRYAKAVAGARQGFTAPSAQTQVEVVERLEGNATTDFGAPGIPPKADDRPLDAAELKRRLAILKSSWAAFDRAAETHRRASLRKGPRGGGRELPAIRTHILEADRAYLSSLGGVYPKEAAGGEDALMKGVREAMLGELTSRARGEPPAKPRRSGRHWTPSYTIRRSAWHALDHAWEIEDRASRTTS
jgi:hypothetical protein